MIRRKSAQELADRDELLAWADRIVRHHLGDEWTLERHMAEKTAVLAELDAAGITSFRKKESTE